MSSVKFTQGFNPTSSAKTALPREPRFLSPPLRWNSALQINTDNAPLIQTKSMPTRFSPVSSSWQPLQFATRPQTDGQMFVQFHVLTQIPNIFTMKMHLSTFKRSILGQEVVYQPLCRWNSGFTIIETLSHRDSG